MFAEDWSLRGRLVQHPSATVSFLRSPEDVLIYHHSIGWDSGVDIVKAINCRKIIKYHNVTPPTFYGIGAQHQRLCQKGRSQLRSIVVCEPDLYLAASLYNKNDLQKEGAPDWQTFVVPPFNNADKLQATEPNLSIIDSYTDGNINLLMVGGVRPNNGHVALIEAFATYYYKLKGNARLFIVGIQDAAFDVYSRMLGELIDQLCLESCIVFTGEVSGDCLKAYYLLAHVFLMASEGEDFCVPLVEAMAMKLPIVAYASAAVFETAGNAGLIWKERDPYLIAESIDYLLRDEAAGVALGVKGWQRYERSFSNQVIEKQFLDATAKAGFDF
jgi:glycosyltransferase involved in cell wall biosynthesis